MGTIKYVRDAPSKETQNQRKLMKTRALFQINPFHFNRLRMLPKVADVDTALCPIHREPFPGWVGNLKTYSSAIEFFTFRLFNPAFAMRRHSGLRFSLKGFSSNDHCHKTCPQTRLNRP
jgi:hypothetical protein